MKKYFIFGSIGILIFLVLFVFRPRQKVQSQVTETPEINTTLPSGGEKIEILAFHKTQRCISCVNASKFIKSVISEKFSDEISLGKIIFREVNIDLMENRKLSTDYQVSGSSLYIVVTKDGQSFREEDASVWRYVTDEAKFKNYFEAKLRKLL